MWVRIEYLNAYNKRRGYTIGTQDLSAVQKSLNSWGILPEQILSVTIDGKEVDLKEIYK